MHRLIPLGRALVLVVLLAGLTSSLPAVQAVSPGVLITEFQAANTSTIADDRGGYSDWLELYNPTDRPITLAGYTLSDDPTVSTKWSLPAATLAPGDFLVVWASGLDQVTPAGWHTSFRLSRGGEYVGLFDPGGQVVDEVTFGAQAADVSLGRLGTVSEQWVAFSVPTPAAANTTWHRLLVPADAPPVEITPGSGRFAGPVTVELYPPVPGSLLYYTLDGADPMVGGHEYTAPLAADIQDRDRAYLVLAQAVAQTTRVQQWWATAADRGALARWVTAAGAGPSRSDNARWTRSAAQSSPGAGWWNAPLGDWAAVAG